MKIPQKSPTSRAATKPPHHDSLLNEDRSDQQLLLHLVHRDIYHLHGGTVRVRAHRSFRADICNDSYAHAAEAEGAKHA